MTISIKKLLPLLVTTAMLTLNSCGYRDGLDTTGITDQVQAESLFSSSDGTLADNGDTNLKIDNQTLSRRTYNNAPAQYFIDGVEAYPAMERLIDSAKKSLYVETFIFRDDLTGRKIAEKLVARKRQGIDVKVIIDSMGIKDEPADKRIYDYLVSQKMDVLLFNKNIFSIYGINITHRKLIIVDGDKAITGGMNFANEYENVWHDSMFQVSGEVVQDIQKEFFADWTKSGGKMPAKIPTLKPGVVYGNIPMRVVVTSPSESKKRYDFKKALLAAIDNAKSRITIETPYLSDDDLILHLSLARQKGVNVTAIIPKTSDLKVYNYINIGNAKTLIKNSVNMNFYQPRFTHIKATIIDNMAFLGSANLDRRSFEENQELNIVIEDPALMQDLSTRLFENDLSQSRVEDLSTIKVPFFKSALVTVTELLDYYL